MNKVSLLAIYATLLSSSAFAAVTQPEDWWENQAVVGVNKEPAHATYTPYPSVAELKADSRFFNTPWVDSKSSLRKSLNGVWKFSYAPKPSERPMTFWQEGFDVSSWADIPVPSCWQMQGYDTPIYVNVDFPFDSKQLPKIVRRADNDGYDENPVGSYVTTFSVPASWSGKQLFVNFEGIYSAAYVWVNGRFVGYTQASNTNHEFDITEAARQGANTLAVQVFKWSDGSFLEDQDMFRWGGIFRDVTLTAVPTTFVRDHYITADLDDSFTSGTINVDLDIDNRSAAAFSGTAELTLLAPDGKTVTAKLPTQTVSVAAGKSVKVSASARLSDLLNWTAETPNLYTVIVSLKDASGAETEAFATKYGFRHIEVRDRFVYINGRKVFFKGVNRQDTHPLTGRSMDTESLLNDVLMFKRYNINTVRTSHCPHQPKMMAMYDHFGIYVMDEADVETHALDWAIVNDDSWTDAYVDRERRMVLRDRNYPSVIFWSMGNESRNGSNFRAARQAIADLDSRMVHYEGQQVFDNSDLTSKMYPNEYEVRSMDGWADQRPHFICEYAHAMGQSLGNFVDYWNYFENSNRTIGGCIWDWADQAIYDPREIAAGTYVGRFYTGYDYPGPNQGNFMSNGVVNPLREVSAKLVEVKKVHQWIKMSDFSSRTGRLKVTNTYDFTDLSAYRVLWSVSRDGVDVESGAIDNFNCKSEATQMLTIPYKTELKDDAEYLMTVRFVTRNASDWAEAGHVVAEEQFAMNERPKLPAINLSALSASLQTRGNGPVVVAGEGFSYGFDASGNLVSMNFNGHDYIYNGEGLKFDSFRWIENDAPYSGVPPTVMTGDAVNGTEMFCSFSDGDARGAKAVHLTARFSNPAVADYTNYYTIYADGTLDVRTVYTARSASLSRLGQSISLNPALENLEYFARGPLSNYVDRKTASFAAVYNSTVTDQHEHFIHPQSMSNHEDLRYLKLTSPKDPGFGLLIEAEGQAAFSALHFAESDYTVSHDFELRPRPEVILHLDYMQKGLGNGSCGSGIWDRYTIPVGTELSNTLRFTPLATRGAGYLVPAGTKGAYLTSLSGYGIAFSASGAPAELYTALSAKAAASPAKTVELAAAASAAARIAAWVDFNHDFEFSASEAATVSEGVIRINVPADAVGDYCLRIVLDSDGAPAANGPVASGSVYDLTLRVASASASEGEAEYAFPSGTMHADGNAFVTSVTSSGADTDISYSASEAPESFHTVLHEPVKVVAGGKFDLRFVANEAVEPSANGHLQDLRWNYAVVYVDLENSGKFERLATVGSQIKGASANGNYDAVMDFTQTVAIPANTRARYARIRVIYQNAWSEMSRMNAFISDVNEGISYDVRIEISHPDSDNSDFTTLPELTREAPEGTMHGEGKAWVKQISTLGAKTDIDYSWTEAPEFFTLLPQTVEVEPGQQFTLSLLANKVTEPNATGHCQDLRFNTASIFTDWHHNIEMTRETSYGEIMDKASDNANYDVVLDINHSVRVPADAVPGRTVIRVIYQNAWRPYPVYNAKDILEGVAYDIPVLVSEPKQEDSIGSVTLDPSAGLIYDLQGRRVVNPRRGLYIVNGRKTVIK